MHLSNEYVFIHRSVFIAYPFKTTYALSLVNILVYEITFRFCRQAIHCSTGKDDFVFKIFLAAGVQRIKQCVLPVDCWQMSQHSNLGRGQMEKVFFFFLLYFFQGDRAITPGTVESSSPWLDFKKVMSFDHLEQQNAFLSW